MTTMRDETSATMLPLHAVLPETDCPIAHGVGPSEACATCSLNTLRDRSKPARSGWLQACIITLAIAVPVMAFLIVAVIVWG